MKLPPPFHDNLLMACQAYTPVWRQDGRVRRADAADLVVLRLGQRVPPALPEAGQRFGDDVAVDPEPGQAAVGDHGSAAGPAAAARASAASSLMQPGALPTNQEVSISTWRSFPAAASAMTT